jgi:selenocysteine-specific elongation factor
MVHDKGILSADGLHALSQMDRKTFQESLEALSSAPDAQGLFAFGNPKNYIAGETFDALQRSALRILLGFHEKYPERSGLDAEELYSSLNSVRGRIKMGAFKDLLGVMAARQGIVPVAVQGKTRYRAADHREPSPDGKLTELAGRIREAIAAAGFSLVKMTELAEKLGVPSSDLKRAAAYLREQEDLRILEGGLLFSRQMRDRLLAALASMQGDITVASVRDLLGVGRKDTSAMLEFLDSQGATQRIGDKRIITR